MSTPSCALLSALVSLFLFSSSQAQTVAFQADFDQDTVGEEPNLDPPGEPSGDYILISTSGGIITVEESLGTMTNQPVVLDNRSSGSLNLRTYLDPSLTSCNTYLVRWTGMLTEANDTMSIGFYGSSNFAALYYRDGGLEYNLTPLQTTFTPNVPQTFEVTIDIPARKTSLSIDGYDDPEAQDRNFASLNPSNTFVRVFFSLGGFDYAEYAIDDIEIIATDCTVPTEKLSWGAVKSRFD